MKKLLLSFFLLTITLNAWTQKVGIGNSAPTETLDVGVTPTNKQSIKFSGSVMPNGDPGTAGAFLLSSGPGAAPYWGPVFMNAGSISTIAHAYVINITLPFNSVSTITVSQLACNTTSAIWGWCWAGPLPGTPTENANIRVTNVQTKNGSWNIVIENKNPSVTMTGLALSFIAFY